jgi:hypothetical protein
MTLKNDLRTPEPLRLLGLLLFPLNVFLIVFVALFIVLVIVFIILLAPEVTASGIDISGTGTDAPPYDEKMKKRINNNKNPNTK